jgi:hypothetical protein
MKARIMTALLHGASVGLSGDPTRLRAMRASLTEQRDERRRRAARLATERVRCAHAQGALLPSTDEEES